MPDDTWVKVRDVVVPRKRMRVANHVEDLAASIGKIGLLNPITLRRDGSQLILIAGRRRLEATKLLRQGEIRARVVDMDATLGMLAEIDENLQREELTALQRGQHTAERQKIWESIYPETRHGGAPGNKGNGRGKAPAPIKDEIFSSLMNASSNGRVESFTRNTAKKTGVTQRTVQHSAQIGSGICSKAQSLLEGTPLEDRKNDLLRLARLDTDTQVAVATVINEGQANTFLAAKKLIEAEAIASEPPPLPAGPFRVIVADPPWRYDKREDDASKRENTTYATMSIEDIRSLDVQGLACNDSILWLWTTNAHLPEAFSVVEAWGFTYKTLLTWDKGRIGMGDWLRGRTEHCLLCVRGKPTVTLREQSTLITEMRGRHSAKPDAFYQLVESLCPGSKVELFARSARPDWAQWGFEVGA